MITRTHREWDKRVNRNAWITVNRANAARYYSVHYSTYYCLCHADENRYLMTRTNHWPSIVTANYARASDSMRKSSLFVHELVNKSIVKLTARDAINNCKNTICWYALRLRPISVTCNILYFWN